MASTNAAQHAKALTVAYILWLLLGPIGAHRFYLGRILSGIAQFGLLVVAVLALGKTSFLAMLAVGWWLLDAFLMPRLIDINSDEMGYSEPTLNPEDVKAVNNLNEQYMSYFRQGNLAAAITVSGKALTLTQTLLGNEHPHVAVLLSNQGEFYRQQGNAAQAVDVLKKAVAIEEKLADNQNLSNSLNNLALAYADLGQKSDAEQVYRRALQLLSARPSGKSGASYVNALNNLAMVYADSGEADKALPLFEEATALIGRLPVEEAPLKIDILSNHAAVLADLALYERAESLYQRAMLLLKKQDESGPRMAGCHQRLGEIYHRQGRLPEAEQAFNTALASYEQGLGANHPETIKISKSLAVVQSALSSAESMATDATREDKLIGAPKLAAVRSFCQLLLWGNLLKAEECFTDFARHFQSNPSDLHYALRLALAPVIADSDWNELDFMLNGLKSIAKTHQIPGEFSTCSKDDFNLDDPEAFFTRIGALLGKQGFHLWNWDIGMSAFCAFITRAEDRAAIDQVAKVLDLTLYNAC